MKKLNKNALTIILIALLTFSATNSYAFITLDPAKGVGKIVAWVSDKAKDVQEKITDLQRKIKGMKWLQDGINAVKFIKATYDATVEMMRKYQKIYNDAMDSDVVKIAQLTKEIKELDEQIKTLEAEKENVPAELNANLKTQTDFINQRIKGLQESNEFYQDKTDEESKKIIEENNIIIEELTKEITTISEENDLLIEETQAQKDAEIEKVKEEKKAKEDEIKAMAKSFASDFLNDTLAMVMATDLNFVAANKKLDSFAREELKKKRVDERNKVTLDAFAKTLSIKANLSDKLSDRKAFATNTDGLEQISAAILMLTSNKVEDIEDLLIYVELMLWDLKMQNANDLVNLKEVQMIYNTNNQNNFDLAYYKFDYDTEKLKEQSMSANDIISSAKDIYDWDKSWDEQGGIVGDLKDQFLEGGFEDEWKDFGADIFSINEDGSLGSAKTYHVGNDTFENMIDYTIGNAKSVYDWDKSFEEQGGSAVGSLTQTTKEATIKYGEETKERMEQPNQEFEDAMNLFGEDIGDDK